MTKELIKAFIIGNADVNFTVALLSWVMYESMASQIASPRQWISCIP